jgi:pilus assembly protein Flp/PilA
MNELARRFRDDTTAATAVEYALMVALIAVAIILSVGLLSGAISQLFSDADREIQRALN